MTQITFTLERLIGGAVLLLLIGLTALTFGVPARADATAPIIVMEQRAAEPSPAPPAGAEPTPALAMPAVLVPPTVAPTAEPTPAIVAVESPPAAPAPAAESKLVVESDGHVRLPGVDDWYMPPPPPPEPTAAPVVSAPPAGNYCPRCGWRPPERRP